MGSRRGTVRAAVAVASLAGLSGCLPSITRDLSAIPPGQVGFDDLCGLQDYFDTMEVKKADPPILVSSTEMERGTGAKAQRGGQARFAFATDFQLKKLREVLHQNWKRLPPELDTAPRIDLGVVWSERAGVRRVVTDRAAELLIERERTYLPYHVCLSELLFGAPLYQKRREVLGLPPIEPTKTTVTTETPVAKVAPPSGTASGTAGGAPGANPPPANVSASAVAPAPVAAPAPGAAPAPTTPSPTPGRPTP